MTSVSVRSSESIGGVRYRSMCTYSDLWRKVSRTGKVYLWRRGRSRIRSRETSPICRPSWYSHPLSPSLSLFPCLSPFQLSTECLMRPQSDVSYVRSVFTLIWKVLSWLNLATPSTALPYREYRRLDAQFLTDNNVTQSQPKSRCIKPSLVIGEPSRQSATRPASACTHVLHDKRYKSPACSTARTAANG